MTTTSTISTLAAATGPFDAEAFDAVISAATIERGDLSAGVAVMRNGVVVHATGLGVENPDGSKTATSATRFRIASVSKVFTAVAVMQLVADGKIALDKPFAAQLGLSGPFADARLAAITVRQLLSHTSGFPASKNMYFGRGVETWQQAGMAAVSQVLQSDPGAGFQYSNTNYCLLGLLLEHVTAKPFESLIRRQVLQPIGADAHLAPTVDTTPGDAVHATSPGRNYMEALGPAGGWVASPVDIAKLASALRFDSAGEHLLDAAAVDEMRTTFGVPGPKDDWTYGLGFELFADGSWGHTGSIESTHAIVVNRPDGFTVAVLVSGKAPGNTDDLLGVIDLAIAGSRHG